MVSAGIAYDALRDAHRDTIRAATTLLQSHPFYTTTWQASLRDVPEADRERYLLMLAATWPDAVRMHRQFHHGEWHYINQPYKPKGVPRRVKVADPVEPNILTAYEYNVRMLKDRGASIAERAIALCWVLHLVGDVHQPLHTSAYYTEQWPEGDRGGNLFHIRGAEGRAVITLHAFWDGLVLGSDRLQSVTNRATLLANAYPRARLPELKQRRISQWAGESFDLVKKAVYLEGKLKGSPTELDGAPLTQAYRDSAKAAAERRITAAGYRIADVLVDALE